MFRNIALSLSMIILVGLALPAQNLVSNSSFETNSGCPGGPCEWQRPTGWNNVNMLLGCGSYGTPDYFHTCGAGFSHLPNNGYLTCNPHTGNAVMGFLTWSGSLSPNFRELVSTRLTSPMTIGQSYTVSFWICNAFTPYYGGGSNHVGLDFSTTPLVQGGGISNVVSLVPEYEIPGVFFSSPWVNYTFTITPTAAWEYITFGNFYNDAATTATLFYAPAPFFRCYYFIDDVSITTTVVLPLQIDGPRVSATGQGSSIAWLAHEEDGIVQYTVERSRVADTDFEVVGHTTDIGRGNYALPDNAIPQPGTWYYRIKVSDANGQSIWSEVATFTFEPTFPLISFLAPNPSSVQQFTRLGAWLPRSCVVTLEVMDLQGRHLAQSVVKADAGENEWILPTATLASGAYLLRLSTPTGVASCRFVVE